MPGYTASHVKDDEDYECPEVVGSTDLRETFKNKDRLRGSFSLNGYMFNQFEANSIENLLAQLHGKEAQTHVIATIDDGYHLVLEAKSPSPIVIHRGPAYQEVPPPGADPVAAQVVAAIRADAAAKEEDKKEEPKNTILEDLGLPETEQKEGDVATMAPGTPRPGMKAEDRQKRREHEVKIAKGEIPPETPAPIPAGQTPLENVSSASDAPITGTGDTNRTLSGAQRTGQGEGYHGHPDGTPPVSGASQGASPQLPS
jgi:hypothetical protein